MNRREKHLRKYIPRSIYCYDRHGLCKFYKVIKRGETWEDDICRCEYLNYTFDVGKDGVEALLFLDDCKCCGIKDTWENEPLKRYHFFKVNIWKEKQKVRFEKR